MRPRPIRLCLFLIALQVFASTFGPKAAQADDTLILTDGMKTGEIVGCDAEACTLDGAAVPRASTYYIGLDAELPPPAPQDPLRDEVHLRDGSVHAGPLVSIDATLVVTVSASYPRGRVTWIWLTPVKPGSGQGSGPAAPTESSSAGDEAAGRLPSYEWDGVVRVENRFADSMRGRHRWRAAYRLKFLEVGEIGAFAGANGHPTSNNRLELSEFAYAFDADQVWQLYPLADEMRTITMHGHAGRQLGGNRAIEANILQDGIVWGVYEPTAAPYGGPSSFASVRDAAAYGAEQLNAPEPGWYHFSIDFHGVSEGEQRALYHGIELGGTWWDSHPIDDQAFLAAIPVCMPTPTWVTGRLDRPDQAEVRGGFSFPYRSGDDMSEEPNQIAVEWSFTRTRR